MTTHAIDIAKTRFIVTAWPHHRWPLETIRWLEQLTKDIEPQADYRHGIKKANQSCARNTAVRTALHSREHYRWFVFIDQDVRPNHHSEAFLNLPADIKCCQMKHRTDRAWSQPTSFHDGLWCTRREVLEKIKPPWFSWRYNEDGTEMDGCICQSFRDKAIAAGFSIAHGGWAEHDREGSWCG